MTDCPVKEFASLHGHSHFSLFDGLSTPEENVKAAKEKGLRSVALTDHGSCSGHADLFFASKKHGQKVVYGSEAYVIHDLVEWRELKDRVDAERKSRGKKETTGEEADVELQKVDAKVLRRKGHLVILACNRTGLANLNVLTYGAFRDGFYGKPRMDKRMLREHAAGLVASSACMGGVISKVCWDVKDGRASWVDAVREVLEFDGIFGRGRFFLELQLNEHEGQRFINEAMVRLSQETGVPLTVTTDFHYSRAEEWEAREVLHMLDWNKTVKDFPGNRIDAEIKQLYVKSPEDMWRTYLEYGRYIPEGTMLQAFENTLLIDGLVEAFEPDTRQRLPKLRDVPNPFAELGQRAIEGLKRLGLADRDEYKARFLHEMRTIKEKGISEYFVIVQNIVREAKKTMLVGAGRGSSAGSLVCYALGITDLDPIRHGLLFERFLDPTRVELPDIDIDFQDVEAAKDMLRRMFGRDNVACLSTWGTFQIKGLLKDLGRVYDLDHNEINRLNRLIEQDLRVLHTKGEDKSSIVIKLEDIERVSGAYKAFVAQHPHIGEHVCRLYGRNRHVGRHASGVIVGDNLPAETALLVTGTGEDRVVQTSFTDGIVNKNISNMGMVKFDILSIATLKVIDHTLRLLAGGDEGRYQELKEGIRAHNIDLNDPKVMRHVFWDGNFAGIFQFTEKGIRRLAMRIRPDCFEDISAICSLYRPGPLGSGMDKLYGENKRKHQAGELEFEHPILAEVLASTYGCLVYQEQLMQVCARLGKMEFKDVQRIRKQLLKKDKSRSDEYRKKENDELSAKFIVGCQENGLTRERAEQWWSDILFFGGYGFNVAHSKSYSVMTMQCAHLATYHPLEFYSAVLSVAQAGDLQAYVTDIKKCGIRVLPVDVTRSHRRHVIEDVGGSKAIRLSLLSVMGVGSAAVEHLIENREGRGVLLSADRVPAASWEPVEVTDGKSVYTPLAHVSGREGVILEVKDKVWSMKGVDPAEVERDGEQFLKPVGPRWHAGKAVPVVAALRGRALAWLEGKGARVVREGSGHPYTSFVDFFRRSGCSKTTVLPLIQVGAFEELCENVRALELYYEELCKAPRLKSPRNEPEAVALLERLVETTADYLPHEKVAFENALMGFSLRGSPFDILDRDRKVQALFDGVALDYREFIEGELEVGMLPVLVKDVRERPQRNGKLFAFLKCAVETGEEFETVCFANIWQHIGHRVHKGKLYVMTFNRRPEDPQNLVVGKPGFAHSATAAMTYAIDVDEIEL